MAELMRDGRSADEIRRDIEGTRSDLHRTIDALERKLSVGQVIDELWDRFRGGRSAGSAASDIGSSLREHPIPLALMGLGVAWLAVERSTAGRSQRMNGRTGERRQAGVGPGTWAPAEGRVGPYGPDAIHGGGFPPSGAGRRQEDDEGNGLGERASDVAHKAKDMASGAMETVREKASDAMDTARRRSSEMRDRASSASSGMRERVSGEDDGGSIREHVGEGLHETRERVSHGMEHGASRVRHGFRTALEEQPLAMGAVAFGLGLASGLSVPSTRLEDRSMGAASDRVTHAVGERVREATEDAKEVGEAALDAARDEMSRQEPVNELVESGRSIAREAKHAARERAEEKGMGPDATNDRDARTGARARDDRGERTREDAPNDRDRTRRSGDRTTGTDFQSESGMRSGSGPDTGGTPREHREHRQGDDRPERPT